MKKIFLMAVASLLIITGANAQTQNHKRSSEQKKEWSARQNMDLTQDQKDQMQKLREEGKKEREKINADKNLTDAQRTEKIRELQKNQREKMNAVLTKEQRETMKSNRGKMGKSDRSERMRSQDHEMRKGMDNAYTKLSLTQTQRNQMQKINEENKAKRDAIKNDSNLSKEQRMEKMKELNAESKKQRDAVLTKEQKDQLKSMRTERQGKGKRPAHRMQPAKQ